MPPVFPFPSLVRLIVVCCLFVESFTWRVSRPTVLPSTRQIHHGHCLFNLCMCLILSGLVLSYQCRSSCCVSKFQPVSCNSEILEEEGRKRSVWRKGGKERDGDGKEGRQVRENNKGKGRGSDGTEGRKTGKGRGQGKEGEAVGRKKRRQLREGKREREGKTMPRKEG